MAWIQAQDRTMQGVDRCMEHGQGDPEDAPARDEQDSAGEPRLGILQGWCSAHVSGGWEAKVRIARDVRSTHCDSTAIKSEATIHVAPKQRFFVVCSY